ncbi:MAG: anti-sigma factor [Planctomycetes bacterium]|nr:anti-sigma factor [Planctomycetota bacterium]
MNDRELALEALAETVVFAHEGDASAAAATAATAPTATGAATASPLRAERAAFERTAALAAAALVAAGPKTAPPAALQAKLAAAGLSFCAERRGPQAPLPPNPNPPPTGSSWRAWPMALALATGLAAGFGLCRSFGCPTPSAPAPLPSVEPTALLASDPHALRLPWQKGPSALAGAVTGEVVWSPDQQQGVLVFRGLPPLDPDHRFQLWIVDGTREGAPVDGGLFAVANTAETRIPVQAKLPIGKAAAFVVTVEGKDGAVVSKQEHVVAIAAL